MAKEREEQIKELQKQLQDIISQNKEIERKRKRDEAEYAVTLKALKKSVDAAEKEKEKAELEKENALQKLIKLEEDQRRGNGGELTSSDGTRVVIPKPATSHSSVISSTAIIPSTATHEQQTMYQGQSQHLNPVMLGGMPHKFMPQQYQPPMASMTYPPVGQPAYTHSQVQGEQYIPINNVLNFCETTAMLRMFMNRR